MEEAIFRFLKVGHMHLFMSDFVQSEVSWIMPKEAYYIAYPT
jgi:hypothetical protein